MKEIHAKWMQFFKITMFLKLKMQIKPLQAADAEKYHADQD